MNDEPTLDNLHAVGDLNAPFYPEPTEEEIPMTPILGSSQIAMVGWKDDALDVQFTSGGRYRYAECPKAVALALLAAQSAGRYLAQHVKGVYEFERLS